MSVKYPTCMPFGKYKGVAIENVPSHYLYWVINNVDPDNEAIESIINKCDQEYNWREETNNPVYQPYYYPSWPVYTTSSGTSTDGLFKLYHTNETGE